MIATRNLGISATASVAPAAILLLYLQSLLFVAADGICQCYCNGFSVLNATVIDASTCGQQLCFNKTPLQCSNYNTIYATYVNDPLTMNPFSTLGYFDACRVYQSSYYNRDFSTLSTDCLKVTYSNRTSTSMTPSFAPFGAFQTYGFDPSANQFFVTLNGWGTIGILNGQKVTATANGMQIIIQVRNAAVTTRNGWTELRAQIRMDSLNSGQVGPATEVKVIFLVNVPALSMSAISNHAIAAFFSPSLLSVASNILAFLSYLIL